MPEYANWSLERIETALEEVQQKHYDAVMESKARIRDLQRARDRKLAEEEAMRITSGMTDDQKAALVQAIKTSGVESSEKLGTPGH